MLRSSDRDGGLRAPGCDLCPKSLKVAEKSFKILKTKENNNKNNEESLKVQWIMWKDFKIKRYCGKKRKQMRRKYWRKSQPRMHFEGSRFESGKGQSHLELRSFRDREQEVFLYQLLWWWARAPLLEQQMCRVPALTSVWAKKWLQRSVPQGYYLGCLD